jgi:hypothetical protein
MMQNLPFTRHGGGQRAAPGATLRVMEEPLFIGWYHQHSIRIYRDDDETPWLVVFEPGPFVDALGNRVGEIRFPEARERTADAAKHTAWALAQNYLSDLLPVEIKWRTSRED